MKKHVSWWAASLLTAAMVVGCGNSDSGEEPWVCIHPVDSSLYHLNLTNSELKLVDETNNFAFNLFRQVAADKSAIVSPISITYALGMLNNGAAGATQTQIDTVLGFGSTGAQDINEFCHKMIAVAPALDTETKVMIANAIFTNKDYQLKSDFVSKALAYYEAEAHSCDFRDGKTAGIINKWASDHTEGMITNVLDRINPYAVSYLLNAIYFKGSWAKKFDKAMTMKEAFNHAGSTKEMTYVDMMRQTSEFEYAETDDCQALRLPYGNGSFQMTVLLPKGQTNALPKVPTAEEWHQLNNKMSATLVDVLLPRLETDTDIDLKPIMTRLGMPDAFNEKKADFRYFCNVPVCIELMKQVAKIKLDEEGTEAAAVTVIGVTFTSVETEPMAVVFHANHPFLYVISEKQTGTVFFIGQYTGY